MSKADQKGQSLTEAERARVARFEQFSEELQQQGYVRHDLTINMVVANAFAVGLMVLLFVLGYGLFYLVHHTIDFFPFNPFVFLVAFVVLTVLHELIHGVTWSFFTPNHFKDIEFGFMKSTLTPYCACLVPLKREHHLIGTVMPLIILGIIPMVVGIATFNTPMLFMGIIMADGAAGDILIIHKILSYKTDAQDIVYMDHPTDAGGVVFER